MRIRRMSGSLLLVLTVVACERSPEAITGNAPRPSMATATATAAATSPQGTIGINVLLKGPATAAQLAQLNTLGAVTDQIPELNAVLMRGKAGQLPAIQALPFVLVANPDAERMRKALIHGAAAFLTKPYTLAPLFNLLEQKTPTPPPQTPVA